MTTAGPNSPGSIISTDLTGSGTEIWGKPYNAETSNDDYSFVTVDGDFQNSVELLATDLGFDLGESVTIEALSVQVEVKLNAGEVRLYIGNTVDGVFGETSVDISNTADELVTVELDVSSLSPAAINDPTFGVYVRACQTVTFGSRTVRVDQIVVTVTHDGEGPPPPLSLPGPGPTFRAMIIG